MLVVRGVRVRLRIPDTHIKGKQKQKLPCSVSMIGADRTLQREGEIQQMTRKSAGSGWLPEELDRKHLTPADAWQS